MARYKAKNQHSQNKLPFPNTSSERKESELKVEKPKKLDTTQTHEMFKRTLFIRTKCNMQIFGVIPFFKLQKRHLNDSYTALIVQELCESRGGRAELSVLTSLLVSVNVKNY